MGALSPEQGLASRIFLADAGASSSGRGKLALVAPRKSPLRKWVLGARRWAPARGYGWCQGCHEGLKCHVPLGWEWRERACLKDAQGCWTGQEA